MHPTWYRTRLLFDVCRALLLPSTILTLILNTTHTRLGFLTVPSYALFIVTWAFGKCLIRDTVQAFDAKRLGAVPITRVQGKWPGNVDVLYRMMKAFKTSYILDVYLGLFEEYQCTTLNLRIFGVDQWTFDLQSHGGPYCWFGVGFGSGTNGISTQIITMDEDHSKFVIATGFHRFWRGTYQKERMESFLGNGIFNRDDEMWKMHRGIARPFLARERISDFELFERHVQHTLSIISSASSGKLPVEAQDLYARFTLDTASEFLFGQNLDTLSGTLPTPGKASLGLKGSATHDEFGSFTQAFEACQQIITNRARIGYIWPLFELFGDKTAGPVKTIGRWLDPHVERAISDKIRMHKAGVQSSVSEKTFLQHLADSTNDPVLIRDQLLSMLLASRDTTACLLTFVTYFMALHPEVTQKLRAEVLQHCGPTQAPTYEAIKSLRYMRAVINETLRLFPPVPLNVRESRAACALPLSDRTFGEPSGPLYMPGKTNIVYLPLLVQRNTALWGTDADVFDPERWLDPARLSIYTSNPMMYAPFSAGPRVCIGQQYALNEATYFLVRLLQQYDTFTLVPEAQPEGSLPPEEWKFRRGRQTVEKIWPSAALTLYVKGGLWVRYSRSSQS